MSAIGESFKKTFIQEDRWKMFLLGIGNTLLMILYYIVFAKAGISGTSVSIVGFTLIFAASVYSMLKAGVSAVDIGQTEAAYALG